MIYPVKANHKILGLNINTRSFVKKHVTEIVNKANKYLVNSKRISKLNKKAKLHITKALIVPTISYPSTILATAAFTNLLKLQTVLNDSLRFVFNIRYPLTPTCKSLHERAKMKPINQTIHLRSNKIWDRIEQGIAADLLVYNEIMKLDMHRSKYHFPSSHDISIKEEPPPVYTKRL